MLSTFVITAMLAARGPSVTGATPPSSHFPALDRLRQPSTVGNRKIAIDCRRHARIPERPRLLSISPARGSVQRAPRARLGRLLLMLLPDAEKYRDGLCGK